MPMVGGWAYQEGYLDGYISPVMLPGRPLSGINLPFTHPGRVNVVNVSKAER